MYQADHLCPIIDVLLHTNTFKYSSRGSSSINNNIATYNMILKRRRNYTKLHVKLCQELFSSSSANPTVNALVMFSKALTIHMIQSGL